MVDLIMNIDEVNEQMKVSRDMVKSLADIESKVMDLLTMADNLGRTSQYFDKCMVRLEGLHGDVESIRHDWDEIT